MMLSGVYYVLRKKQSSAPGLPICAQFAALAQSVERRLGKAEVGGSSPLGSSEKNPWNSKGSFFITSAGKLCFCPSEAQ